ncbi:MAG TPA: MBL fold metallo-hydrolase [Candidatus Angelobacter sp.]|nr:MBL fold metallo-hydrolase [Candidatus Angelobacter sp.]
MRLTLLMWTMLWLSGAAAASTQKIGDGLYAYVSSNESSSNSVFLVGDNGILVVDSGLNSDEGSNLRQEIRQVSPLPVRWIVNTHYHPDHRGGNYALAPDAVVVSTDFTRAQNMRSDKEPAAKVWLKQTVDAEGLTVFVGRHAAQIWATGPAHTLGDLVVYFPDQHAIATGDLFLNDSCPYMDEGDLENWIVALDRMLALPLQRVVPGHFAVAGWVELQRFRDYLEELRTQVASMHAQGLSLTQIQQRLNMRAYQGMRQFPRFEATFSDNAAAYYRQLERRKLRTN